MLNATYAMLIEEATLAQQGVAQHDIIEGLEQRMREPAPGEVTPEEAERLRRKRVAAENRASLERMMGMTKLEPARGRRSG